MKTRTCKYCNANKTIDQFELANVVKGIEYRRHKCKRCYQDDKKVYRRRNKLVLEAYKKTQSCKQCGNNDYRVLEFHHRDGDDKEMAIAASIGRWGDKRRYKEIAKCDVLCANCHRILHFEERNSGV
jgi:hypothetical protein